MSFWSTLLFYLVNFVHICSHSLAIAFIMHGKAAKRKEKVSLILFKMLLYYVVCMFFSPTHSVSGVASTGELVLARLFLKAEWMTTMAKGRRGHDHSSFIDRGQM